VVGAAGDMVGALAVVISLGYVVAGLLILSVSVVAVINADSHRKCEDGFARGTNNNYTKFRRTTS
jgi:hypothetical protein